MTRPQSILLVILVALVGLFILFVPKSASQTSLLHAQPQPATHIQITDTWDARLRFGLQPVHSIKITTDGSATLRYLSFEVQGQGLENPEDWELYPIVNREIDYSQAIGQLTSTGKNRLRFKLQGEDSTHGLLITNQLEIAVVTTLVANNEAEPQLQLKSTPDPGLFWAPGHPDTAWSLITNKRGPEPAKL